MFQKASSFNLKQFFLKKFIGIIDDKFKKLLESTYRSCLKIKDFIEEKKQENLNKISISRFIKLQCINLAY